MPRARGHDTEDEQKLLLPPAPGVFDPNEVGDLAEPVRRYFTAAIAPGAPLWRSMRLEMRGAIRIGRWVPFRAHEVLAPTRGFVWTARAAGVITGSDRYLEHHGSMSWKILGLVPVLHADGADISRSGAGRAGAEALWLPPALLPRYGARWEATDDTHITGRLTIDETAVELHHTIDALGHVTSSVFDRWGDPDRTGTYGWHPCGGDVTAYATFHGLTIPSAGSFGWGYGTDRWTTGEFFRYRLTSVKPVEGSERCTRG
jgi:hypothetical protein